MNFTKKSVFLNYSHLRPSMLQQLLRRLVFDVPLLNEYCKMPLKVNALLSVHAFGTKLTSQSSVVVMFSKS